MARFVPTGACMNAMPQSMFPQQHCLVYLTGLVLVCALLAGTPAMAQEPTSPVASELRRVLLQESSEGESPFNRTELERLYGDENFRLLWLGEDGPNHRAELLRERLQQAYREGLVPQHYHTDLIESLWDSSAPSDRMRLELLLSSAFFDYARDVRGGRVRPQQAALLWKIETVPVDPVDMLRQSLLAEDFKAFLDSLPPMHPGYQRLRQSLAQYREIESLGGWPVVPDGPTLRVGIRDTRVAALRSRLQWEAGIDLPLTTDDELFDEGLAHAVERFQARHGLQVDATVGQETLTELNASVGVRIGQIVYNMERWRWLPQLLGTRHLIVNIPAYELIAYDSDEARLTMPVIIGRTYRPTPTISGLLHTVVVNPYWTVPTKLALLDEVPRQRRNPNHLSSHKIRVYSDWNAKHELAPRQIDWSAIDRNYFPYMLRQDPGPKNALGRIKFLFNNPFSVYLHDTPKTELFDENVRTFSSGCIRVKQPLRLAAFVLGRDRSGDWSEQRVQAAIDTGETRGLRPLTRIPVYLLYLTVWVGED